MTTSTERFDRSDKTHLSSGHLNQPAPDSYSDEAMRRLLYVAARESAPTDVVEDAPTVDHSGDANFHFLNGTIISQRTDVRARPHYKIIQEWEGVVESVADGSFRAILTDLEQAPPMTNEIVELPIDDLRESDISKMCQGAIFRWTIGYQIFGNQKQRFSQIIFRDLPVWTEQQIKRATKRAESIIENLPRIE